MAIAIDHAPAESNARRHTDLLAVVRPARGARRITSTRAGTHRSLEDRARSAIHANGDIEFGLVLADAALHSMRVEQSIRVGCELTQSLITTNTTAAAFSLTNAFHTYFHVGDAERIGIAGLAGLTYLDKPANFAKKVQAERFQLQGECDRIYLDTPGDFSLDDPNLARRIRLRSSGSRSLVVWNPNAEKIKAFTDIPNEGWRDYICLEVANAGTDVITLAPGASHRIEQVISATILA